MDVKRIGELDNQLRAPIWCWNTGSPDDRGRGVGSGPLDDGPILENRVQSKLGKNRHILLVKSILSHSPPFRFVAIYPPGRWTGEPWKTICV